MTPEDLPGRGGRDAARIAHRTTLPAAQHSNIADTDCAVDPGDLSPDDAIRTLSVHHHCPLPCRPRERALVVLGTEYRAASTPDACRPARAVDELDRRLAELIREYLRRVADR
ncbi:hypothetical protein [Nocardia gamkensis]|uniref:Uncharacterized protein n=1 Tax=Nocardia gamkensis TaxID=352869 RepID=A0A7X6LBA9_9NOCA|nr:hypothetical protein [Nocardia gamkensis]NKY31293.1 hypothetical protein [Nocardia gamkensis]NQE72308.1 hypothetical protein [Nocardia gamkensis]